MSAPGPFERLLALGEGTMLTSTADTLWVRGPGGSTWSLPIFGAGVTASGEPFISSGDGSAATLWIGESGRARPFPLAPAGLAGRPAAVMTVDGERTLLWSGDRAAWYQGEAVARVFAVDAATYRQEIFPFAWHLPSPYPFSASANGGVLIPVSGPTDLGIIELRFDDPQK